MNCDDLIGLTLQNAVAAWRASLLHAASENAASENATSENATSDDAASENASDAIFNAEANFGNETRISASDSHGVNASDAFEFHAVNGENFEIRLIESATPQRPQPRSQDSSEKRGKKARGKTISCAPQMSSAPAEISDAASFQLSATQLSIPQTPFSDSENGFPEVLSSFAPNSDAPNSASSASLSNAETNAKRSDAPIGNLTTANAPTEIPAATTAETSGKKFRVTRFGEMRVLRSRLRGRETEEDVNRILELTVAREEAATDSFDAALFVPSSIAAENLTVNADFDATPRDVSRATTLNEASVGSAANAVFANAELSLDSAASKETSSPEIEAAPSFSLENVSSSQTSPLQEASETPKSSVNRNAE